MYLSNIEIIGFKSFAQRIAVKFDAGVTAIVGPNGCGKTNIVDAIRWALGEQRYSTLRSDKMEDVIFNGTKDRKPLGLAEVSLSIENTKGILPTEYTEVTITRRVFRSGESEYLLNKVPCRLKDIIDLFMDTGMGSDAYSVIELKMIETILSDKTDERRKLFEEAAGVTKYKHRRKAAMRKLESVQQDLARVNDIVKEVQKTVGSLERQAKKAEQYNEVSGRLKGLEVDLLEREYAYLHGKLRPLEESHRLAATDRSTIDAGLRRQEERVDALRDGLAGIEEELAAAQRDAAAQFEAIHRVEEKILVANERKSSLAGNIERCEREQADLRTQDEAVRLEREGLEVKLAGLRRESAAGDAALAAAGAAHAEAASLLETRKSEAARLHDDLLTAAEELVNRRGEEERLRARIDNARGRIDRSREDNALYEADVLGHERTIADLTARDKDLRRRFAEAEIRLFEREAERRKLLEEADLLGKQALEAGHDIERKKAKAGFLRKMIETNEGYSEGARYLLASGAWKAKRVTTVADVLRIPAEYRAAVEAALADAANLLIVERVEDGYAAVEELARANKGRASFICLPWVPRLRRRGRALPKDLHAVRAADIVACDDRYKALAAFLLDDVVIVQTLGDARAAAGRLAGMRCISLDGQTAGSAGVIRGGSRRHDDVGLIGKRAQIEELEGEIAAAESALGTLTRRHAEQEEAARAFDVKQFADAVKTVEKEMTAIEMRIAQLEFEKKRANDGRERNHGEIAHLEEEILDLDKKREELSASVRAGEERKSALEGASAAAARALEEADALWNDRGKALAELEIAAVTRQGEVRNCERDLERAAARRGDIEQSLFRRDEEIVRAREETHRLTTEAEGRNAELAVLRSGFEEIDVRRKSIEELHAGRRSELHQTELRMKDERRLHDDAVAHSHDLEMKIAELRSGIEHLALRAQEEFELTLELKTYPDDEFVDFAHLREEVKNLKDRIRVLGAINFAAFDEFTTESERLAFLTQQRDDLLDAEKTLLATIEEINTTAQRIFLETFARIRENFIVTFKELFLEGDECDLRLEENVDPLEASIEIIAKPRGKRPTSIDLLSGGEKTLTAIALLFAIYLVKPSPFCILDEVDAPLDDSNIDRFTRILRKFSGNTQFIVVTHNKRTMEAASALYGITMEEQGVSKVVTVRFNEEARVRSATVTH